MRQLSVTCNDPVDILIVDDHPIVRAGFVARLTQREGFHVCGEVDDFEQAIETVRRECPDVVVLDIALKRGNGLDLIQQMKDCSPSTKVVVISMYEDFLHIERALRNGADGYVSKREAPANIIVAIETVLEGQVYVGPNNGPSGLPGREHPWTLSNEKLQELTPREKETLRMLGQGIAIKDIANRLGISRKTVDTYRANLLDKLAVPDHRTLVRGATLWLRSQNTTNN